MFAFARILIIRKSIRSGADLGVLTQAVSEGRPCPIVLFLQSLHEIPSGDSPPTPHFPTPRACPNHERTSRPSPRHVHKQSPCILISPPPFHSTTPSPKQPPPFQQFPTPQPHPRSKATGAAATKTTTKLRAQTAPAQTPSWHIAHHHHKQTLHAHMTRPSTTTAATMTWRGDIEG